MADGKQRITVQTYSMIDGSCREVVANVTADDEQSAVDKLFALAKDEIAYKFLGAYGYLKPSSLPVPPVAIPRTVGEWYVKA